MDLPGLPEPLARMTERRTDKLAWRKYRSTVPTQCYECIRLIASGAKTSAAMPVRYVRIKNGRTFYCYEHALAARAADEQEGP